ncbi:hypothetical protein J4731_02160 [Providencia rettgeri]|nr:hypothetical protein [Providencia rettgeri]
MGKMPFNQTEESHEQTHYCCHCGLWGANRKQLGGQQALFEMIQNSHADGVEIRQELCCRMIA